MEHFKKELVEDQDCYINYRIKAKQKVLLLYFTNTKPFDSLDTFHLEILPSFLGHFVFPISVCCCSIKALFYEDNICC